MKRISVSDRWLKSGGIIVFTLAVLLTAGAVDYWNLFAQSVENKHLHVENTQLKEQFKEVEGKLTALENNLNRVKIFYTKLKLLIPSQDKDERQLQLAVGPLPEMGQGFNIYNRNLSRKRSLSSEPAGKDQKFYQNLPSRAGDDEIYSSERRMYVSLAIRIDKVFEETSLQEQELLQLWTDLSERQSLLTSTPSVRPIANGWDTSRFGYRTSPFTGAPAMHNGIDIAAAPGTPIKAPAAGVVSFVGYDGDYGKLIAIDHGYGVVTRYGHSSETYVTVGQKLSRFDVIAAVGNTGRSTGPHLHYEVRINGVPVDPLNYILNK